jgi:tetratricopeptide (TPR) repeat protein
MNIKKIHILLFLFSLLPSISLYSQEQLEPTYKKAMKYFFERKFEMAQILLQESLKKDPENKKAYSYLGDIFLYKKRYDAALNLYKKALDLDPDYGENYFRIGQIYYYKKNGTQSIRFFQQAVNTDKRIKFAYFHMGLAYLMLERNKYKTIDNWERYLAIAPEDPQYENIRRAIELLRDPNFKLPPKGSEVSIEEALHLGGITLEKIDKKAKDKSAGHEKMKSNKKLEEIFIDDDL